MIDFHLLQSTTAPEELCDRAFGGTSASSPMVAGAIALTLEAKCVCVCVCVYVGMLASCGL